LNAENTLQKLIDSWLCEKIHVYERVVEGFIEELYLASEAQRALAYFKDVRERLSHEAEKELLQNMFSGQREFIIK
jgi:hypothetical protein